MLSRLTTGFTNFYNWVLVGDVEYRVAQVPNVRKVAVELVFDPPWHRDMMSEEAQLETGMFY